MMLLSRRQALVGGGALGFAALSGCAPSAGSAAGNTLVIGFSPEPPTLTSAATTAGPTQAISSKIFDGLVTFDADAKPQPQLALSWNVAPDGLAITFRLRPDVKWHDGAPFTSADISYSLLEVWRKLHGRGRSTFANVTAVEMPDPLTAIIRLSRPAPYLLAALGSPESQIVPRHIYEGKDFLSNPAGNAPIGTGPFRFAEWRRGEFIRLERNPHYWAPDEPRLDGIIYKLVSDPAAAAAALETGEVHLVTSTQIALNDIKRLKALPGIQLHDRPVDFTAGLAVFEFNLDRPALRDVRVRRAFAHAIDKAFLLEHVWHGFGTIENSPIPRSLAGFSDLSVPDYGYDPAKAAQLLDAAGLKPDTNGVRLRLTHDPAPTGDMLQKSALAIRDNLRRVGVELSIRSSDFPGFLKRVYADRDFDTIQYSASAGPDPAIGTQRFYWSQNFKPGVAFSNGAHYASPRVDSLLEQAQQEPDAERRKALYHAFQQQVEEDLPRIPLIAGAAVTIASARVHNLPDTAYGTLDNFAGVSLAPA